MESKSIEDRVALLENDMQSLRGLPDRVASLEEQFVQFRGEVRREFSATREEFRQEIRDTDKSLRAGLAKIDARVGELSVEMHALNSAVMSEMRMLFENAIERIRTIRRG